MPTTGARADGEKGEHMTEAPDYSHLPLLVFMDHVNEWANSVRGDNFWRDMLEHRMWADQLREEAKGAIVWLELRGRDEAAAQLDEVMGALREAIANLEEACEGVYPPDDPRCHDAREAVIETASRVAAAAEDLDQEVPEEVWEGFFDE